MWSGFGISGSWYKGNLHCHSTESDGARAVDEVVAFYREGGYAFLALSDHRRVTDVGRFAAPAFLPLPAMEIDGRHEMTGGPFHMLAIGLQQFLTQDVEMQLPEMLQAIENDGGLSIFCHPYWLGTCATDLQQLELAAGIEVFNANCEVEIAKGYSMQCWDDMLQRGKRFLGFATDDAHWRQQDYGQGWIQVKAQSLDRESILAAIRAGAFYSSSGPEILDLTVADGIAHVRCSPVAAVHFVGDTRNGERIAAGPGNELIGAAFKLPSRIRYLRVECVARDGSRAWSNPLWFN